MPLAHDRRINYFVAVMITVKEQLYQQCLDYVAQRIDVASKAIKMAQDSADEETKSSAGDKYETGRAMMQLEMEKYSAQLAEATRLRDMLERINIHAAGDTVRPGSAVTTDQGNFFIAISAGQLKAGTETFFAVSPVTPIGMKLMGLKEKESFEFNKKVYRVKRIL
jgi:hypothetical protein